MPLFDWYAMVDWTGGNSRRINKADAIWIAHGAAAASVPVVENPASRTDAEATLRNLLTPFASPASSERALVCFDFAYGYPSGVAECLPSSPGTPPWQVVWEYVSKRVCDDVGTTSRGKPTNKSNRFEVANTLNGLLAAEAGPAGPFWCLCQPGSQPNVPQGQPQQPFQSSRGVSIAPLRITDIRASSDTAFRLFGNGSVGSQVLTGIPRLRNLRFDATLRAVSGIWPFETGWAHDAEWPGNARIIHAEIYPSVRQPLADAIRDRGQVRAMWEWARDEDANANLLHAFGIPQGIEAGSEDDRRIREEEGWILGLD